MGSDMANVKTSGKNSNSNLKVPPLKIVLSSHQNNSTFINTNSGGTEVEQDDARDKDLQPETETLGDKIGSRKNSRTGIERKEIDLDQSAAKSTVDSSSSSSACSSNSDRSTTTSPSSESESLDSNLTIISENQTKVNKNDRKEDGAAQAKLERNSRQSNKGSSDRSVPTRKSNDLAGDTSSESTAFAARDHTLNANQRITRSSQRAAQQNRPDETNGDDSCGVSETPDRTAESSRKAKRRKVELQDSEQDNTAQLATQQAIPMANVCPADYKLPAHNSFELYRDIRKRPYEKMLQLNHVNPKTPLGFKDYLLINGPYLLDGNRLGVGLNGPCVNNSSKDAINTNNGANSSRIQLQVRLSNLYKKLSISQASHQRHNSYAIPKLTEVPKSLRVNSALYKLFQVQEKARHQMKMQHLKERERSILAAEQEILRAYNKMAIADNKQKLHLSACTYFYYQESYHYLDDSVNSKKANPKFNSHDEDQSANCSRGSDNMPRHSSDKLIEPHGCDAQGKVIELDSKTRKETRNSKSDDDLQLDDSEHNVDNVKSSVDCQREISPRDDMEQTSSTKVAKTTANPRDESLKQQTEGEKTNNLSDRSAEIKSESEKVVEEIPVEMSDEEMKMLNKSVFLEQLQAIDDKWAKVKSEMFVRHTNESDSLYAVQSLEWEWRAKEIGACDVRVTPKIAPECVPRVEVSALDY